MPSNCSFNSMPSWLKYDLCSYIQLGQKLLILGNLFSNHDKPEYSQDYYFCIWAYYNHTMKDTTKKLCNWLTLYCLTQPNLAPSQWFLNLLSNQGQPAGSQFAWPGLTEESRTTDLCLGLLVLILIRMTRLRQLWTYLRDWFQKVKN